MSDASTIHEQNRTASSKAITAIVPLTTCTSKNCIINFINSQANEVVVASTDKVPKKTVGLFATCLVDIFRPEIGFATAKLLEDAGYEVDVPKSQTCCGQPLINNGSYTGAHRIAKKIIKAFESYDYVVAPSGSCTAVLKVHYPELFHNSPEQQKKCQSLASRSFEITDFLNNVASANVTASYDGHCTYHDSCSGLRELGVQQQPRNLLSQVEGLKFSESKDSRTCCGFGGTFCVKFPEISSKMAQDKADNVEQSGADTLLGGDLGCLMNIAGTLRRRKSQVKVFHIAEILAGQGKSKPIGVGQK